MGQTTSSRCCGNHTQTPDLDYHMQADLAKSLCNNRTEVGSTLGRDFGGAAVVTHSTRVLAAGADWVEMERPLHVDITLKFKPQIST